MEKKKKWIRMNGLPLALDDDEAILKAKVAKALGVTERSIISLNIIKKALDARRNRPPHFVYAVNVQLNDSAVLPHDLPEGIQIQSFHKTPEVKPLRAGLFKTVSGRLPVVVIGSGPAGLFASYTLVLQNVPVLLFERGCPVEKRVGDVQAFWERSVLDQQSNVLFGEGGAGTFSDGKLTSRTKNPYAGWVKQVLVDMGAPSSILTDSKPHIGTDRLRKVVTCLRNALIEKGGMVRFESEVTDLIIQRGNLEAVVVNGRQEIKADKVILAIGQSADDTYQILEKRGVKMEHKPFAMGLRIEHPQAVINEIQYGRWSNHPHLPSAEYFITAALRDLNRSVYTFCMCPGGQVIGCSSVPGLVITNGMSNYNRNGRFANSAVVANVRVDDFAGTGEPLSGLAFRALWEKKAFTAGGGNYWAPAQRLSEFISGQFSGGVGETSFLPGVKAVPLAEMLPEFVTNALRAGLQQFNLKMPGFISQEAHLIGVETRTSSPVRICRRGDGQSENVAGLYPCGEGAGYAGGIISSALDGIRAAASVLASINDCR